MSDKQDLVLEIRRAIAAASGGIWLTSYEHESALAAIAQACKPQGWYMFTWNPANGMILPDKKAPKSEDPLIEGEPNPMEAIEELRKRRPRHTEQDDNRAVLVLVNATPFFAFADGRIGNATLLQRIQNTIEMGTETGAHIIFLTYDHLKLPPELEKMVYPINHPMPGRDEIYELLKQVEDEDLIPAKDSPEADRIINAASGLSRLESLTAFSKSKGSKEYGGRVVPNAIWEMKRKTVEKEGLLTLLTREKLDEIEAPKGFAAIAGLNAGKEFLLEMFNSPNRSKKVRPLGVTAVGVSGGGKSALAYALAEEIGWAGLECDVGKLMGGIIGATESNTRRMFARAEASAPCVLIVNEVEKMFGSVGGGHQGDSGVGQRQFGAFLQFMNDHTSDVFMFFTANDISKIPMELFRAERIDGVFFIDMPGKPQRDAGWDIYIKYFGLQPEQTKERPDDSVWTIAEIKACCRRAAMIGKSLKVAGEVVIPIYNTKKEEIDAMRAKATNRFLSAEYRGVYDQNRTGEMLPFDQIRTGPVKRKVSRVS